MTIVHWESPGVRVIQRDPGYMVQRFRAETRRWNDYDGYHARLRTAVRRAQVYAESEWFTRGVTT